MDVCRIELLQREEHGPAGAHLLTGNRARDPVARRQVAGFFVAADERLAVRVDQPRPFPTQRLGQQKPRLPRDFQRRRMKLHELQIRHRGSGAKSHRDAVTGGDRRIRGLAIDLTRAAGRQQNGGRAGNALSPGRVQKARADARLVLDDQIDDPGVRVRGHIGQRGRARPQNAPDLASGAVTRVQHTARAVRPFDGERRLSVRVAIELERPTSISSRTYAGPSSTSDADGVLVAESVAGGNRVGGVQGRRVIGVR